MEPVSTAPPRTHRTYWWKETLIMGAFYVVYSWTRNQKVVTLLPICSLP